MARAVGKFRYKVENISGMKESQLSPPFTVCKLPWKIMVKPVSIPTKEGPPQKSLGFFLQCNGKSKSTTWNCYAVAELRLLSVKEGQKPFSRQFKHFFNSKVNDWGFSRFMLWQDVLDPDKGYIKDDAITLEAYFVAGAPHELSNEMKRVTDMARSQATFKFTVENISEMKELQSSPSCIVHNLPWKIIVKPVSIPIKEGQPQTSLAFFIQCNGESISTSWSCYAVAKLRLLSVKEGRKPFSRKFNHLFYSAESLGGFKRFMLWQNLLNPDKGFIKNDAITLEVNIVADTPHGLSDEMEKDMARAEVTFRYKVENISEMEALRLSPPYIVHNLPLKIMVKPVSIPTKEGQPQRSLAFFIQCNGKSKSTTWSCYTVAELRLLAVKEGQKPFSRKFKHLFDSKENVCGFNRFMLWQDVLDPGKGYIKDDAITLEVHVVADAPYGVI